MPETSNQSPIVKFEDRITGFGRKPASQFLANPDNPHLHPQAQRVALRAGLESIGWIGVAVENETTGNLIDGHERVWQALSEGDQEVPFITVRLSQAEEAEALLEFDPIGDMAHYDYSAIDRLMGQVREQQAGFIAGVLAQHRADVPSLNAYLPKLPDPPKIGSLNEAFVVPPFSVLDARQGYWRERKARWLALGIQSELGRGAGAMNDSQQFDSPLDRKKHYDSGIISGAPLPLDRNYNGTGKGKARAFREDLMNGEGKLNQKPESASLSGGLTFRTSIHPYDSTGAKRNAEGAEAEGLTGAGGAGTSIFDPVLCELAYRWFSPPGGAVFDPFAGGSVRGIVASKLGRSYTGIELRAEQVAANRAQAARICGAVRSPIPSGGGALITDPAAITPVEQRGAYWLKRDDLFDIGGARGAKARVCWELASGAPGLVTCGSRISPQVNRVAQIAAVLGIPCRAHTPGGELKGEALAAKEAGAEIVQHMPGHNSVIIARARADAAARGWREIPFGMEHPATITLGRAQVANLPREAKRVVIPVGSGMSLAALLWGMVDQGIAIPVLGVRVGGDPVKRLDKYAPKDWRALVTLVDSPLDYHSEAPVVELEGVALDPIYEAKCIPFLQPGDCLWIVGVRSSHAEGAYRAAPFAPAPALPEWVVGDSRELEGLIAEEARFDFLFTCPPYYDLEVYSDDPADLSNAGEYRDFLNAYEAIIFRAVERLKDHRFAAVVVGEIRDEAGLYRNFVGDTVSAFEAAGLTLYNEAIFVTPVGSLPIRVRAQMEHSRKLGKTHQNVLIFVKGDPVLAARACGQIETYFPDEG